jgi:serine/threonine protein phosphatase PrpC
MTSFAKTQYIVDVSSVRCDIGGMKKQQDTGCCIECVGSDGSKMEVVGVFDGHGSERGEKFSMKCADCLISCLSSTGFKDHFDSDPEVAGREICAEISRSCRELNIRHLESIGEDYVRDGPKLKTKDMYNINGGSTGTILFVTDSGLVHCFHVGDSDAWFIDNDTAIKLCSDHSPSSEEEWNRIHEDFPDSKFEYHYQVCCGIPRNPEGSHVFPKRKNFNGYYRNNVNGHMACTFGVDYFSLAMTRAFGDEPMRHGGLIAQPSYKMIRVEESGLIKVATDGYWDNLRDDALALETSEEIKKCGFNAEAIVQEWFSTTEKKAKNNFGTGRDNMLGFVITIRRQ